MISAALGGVVVLVFATLWTLALRMQVLMARVDHLEGRLRGEQSKTSNWSSRPPFRSCGCACYKDRP